MPYISPFASPFPVMPDIAGVTLATGCTGMRYKRDDIFLACFAAGTSVAGVFTQNAAPGEPVKWGRKILPHGKARALVVNAGYANVCTGSEGYALVEATAQAMARLTGALAEEIHICSTGIIGEQPDKQKLLAALPALHASQQAQGFEAATKAMGTTDTFAKGATRTLEIDGMPVHINGIIKGSGMIAPNMATTLSYIFTNAAIPAPILQQMLEEAVAVTLNCVTVDGDTSTSDTCLAFATGKAAHKPVKSISDRHIQPFMKAMTEVLNDLAMLLAKDGEGLTKFVTVHVQGAEDTESARRAGLAIGNSPLVKTALAASDPNWGRIIGALGNARVKLNMEKLDLWIGDVLVVVNGARNPTYKEAEAKTHLLGAEPRITVDLAVGDAECNVYSCDLTHEYISINADYRS